MSRLNISYVKQPIVTALPVSAATGDEVYFQTSGMAALSPAITWHLRYDGSKWAMLGGPPLFSEVDGGSIVDRTLSSTTYTTLAVAGPSVTLPVVGWYDVETTLQGYHSASGGPQSVMSYDIGATAAVDADQVFYNSGVSNTDVQRATRTQRKQFTAAVTLTAKYKSPAGATATFRGGRMMKVTPVLLG